MTMKTLLIACTVAAACALPSSVSAKTVGTVDKVQASVKAERASGGKVNLRPASKVQFKDKLVSGPASRLEATLLDDTKLTLGSNAMMTIDEFVYRPGAEGNRLALDVKGAFLFVGGKIEGPTGGNVAINTPVGTLGVRGTTVWGGYVDNAYGVVVLDGLVTVTTKAGQTVTLKKGQGTMIHKNGVASDPAPWPENRVNRAVYTVTMGGK